MRGTVAARTDCGPKCINGAYVGIFLSDAQDYIVKKKNLCSQRENTNLIIKGSGTNGGGGREKWVLMPVGQTEQETPKVIFDLAKQNTKRYKDKIFVSESVSTHLGDQRSKNLNRKQKTNKKNSTFWGAMQQPSSRLIQDLTNRVQGLDWKAPFKIGPLPQWHSRRKKKKVCRKGRVK